MALKVEVSAGELLDKITILEIKAERIMDPVKLANVKRELGILRETWAASPLSRADLAAHVADLKAVNEALWDIEDGIRALEAGRDFGEAFVHLARAVYRRNDERAAIKRRINLQVGSDLVEEKSYADYDAAEP
ncbi:MAG: hypothetical protein JW819_10110 [Candidatus Krumholzibacteriota bacterium]|nr:hypothetical protein [Candidatus Krumholzibacteriota bacterium]